MKFDWPFPPPPPKMTETGSFRIITKKRWSSFEELHKDIEDELDDRPPPTDMPPGPRKMHE